jgi:hypothetical protein
MPSLICIIKQMVMDFNVKKLIKLTLLAKQLFPSAGKFVHDIGKSRLGSHSLRDQVNEMQFGCCFNSAAQRPHCRLK